MSETEAVVFSRILVPLDGSTLAERAKKPALDLVESGGEIILFRVASLSLAKELDLAEQYGQYTARAMIEQFREDDMAYLLDACQTWASPKVTLLPCGTVGDPASAIVDEAVARQVDLIVMSSHGRSGVARWLLGSVAERVLRGAPCPVFVVRTRRPVRRVLIALDGSELAEQALSPGLALARKLDAELTLLQVVPKVSEDEEQLLGQIDDDLPANTERKAADYLRTVAGEHCRTEELIQTKIVVGLAAEGILETAETLDIDLIVMATHGRTGLRRWAYGSVTEKVLHGCKRSMLIVRPPVPAFFADHR